MVQQKNYVNENDLDPRIKEHVIAYSKITGLPVTYFSESGGLIWECNKETKACSFFDIYKDPSSQCRKSLFSAGKLSSQLGEPYIFVCKAGFVKISMPLIINKTLMGNLIAGPLIMGELKKTTITNIFSLNNINPIDYPELIMFLRGMKMFNPKDVSYLSSVFGNTILGSLTPNSDYQRINSTFKEQRKIGENLQKYKKENKSLAYPYQLESNLFDDVSKGNTEAAHKELKELLLEMSMIEAGDLSAIKTKLLSVFTILIRNATDSNFINHELSDQLYDNLNSINEAFTFDDMCMLSNDLIDILSQNAGVSRYSGHSQLIKSSLQYINQNYHGKLSLNTVATALHTNSSYLSMLFKRNLGVTFTEYLNQTRVAKCCSLLTTTNLSLSEIASKCGFEDQSYFSKVFKKEMNMSPKDYRNKA